MENQQALPVLRPLRLGELLDQAIRLYRRHFLTFIGIIAVAYIPLTILQVVVSGLLATSIATVNPREIFTSPGYWIGIFSTFVLLFIQFILIQGFATGALTRAVANTYLGREINILDSYRGMGRSWLSLLGALLLIAVLAVLAFIYSFIVPCLGWFTGLGMMVFLLGAINPLVPSIVILEGQGPLVSLRRGWSLARRRFWPVLGYIFVLYLFSLIVVTGPTTLVNLALTSLFRSFDNPVTAQIIVVIVQALVGLLFALIYYPLQMTSFTLIYLDLRVRTEGFDITLATMDPASVDAHQIMTPPPAVNERLITGPDLGNFAILTIAAMGLFILYYSLILGGAMFFASLFF